MTWFPMMGFPSQDTPSKVAWHRSYWSCGGHGRRAIVHRGERTFKDEVAAVVLVVAGGEGVAGVVGAVGGGEGVGVMDDGVVVVAHDGLDEPGLGDWQGELKRRVLWGGAVVVIAR